MEIHRNLSYRARNVCAENYILEYGMYIA